MIKKLWIGFQNGIIAMILMYIFSAVLVVWCNGDKSAYYDIFIGKYTIYLWLIVLFIFTIRKGE